VNESAGEQITELLNGEPQLPTTHNLDGADEPEESSDLRPGREGLPRSFRMRHDAHYVDELLAPRTSPAVTAPAQPSALAALALVAGRFESLVAHTGVMGAQTACTPLIAQSVQVEFARLSRVARAAVIANDGDTLFRRSVSAGEIVDAAALAIAPVERLGGIGCDISVEHRSFTLEADPALIVHAIVATVDAIVELLQVQPRRSGDARQPAARVAINVQSMKVRPALIVDVNCPALAISPRQADHFFENRDEEYGTVPAAGILLAAAAHVARSHGGRSDVTRNSGGGVAIKFVYPQPLGDSRFA
jgi:hypothetical protein